MMFCIIYSMPAVLRDLFHVCYSTHDILRDLFYASSSYRSLLPCCLRKNWQKSFTQCRRGLERGNRLQGLWKMTGGGSGRLRNNDCAVSGRECYTGSLLRALGTGSGGLFYGRLSHGCRAVAPTQHGCIDLADLGGGMRWWVPGPGTDV